jgi:hypothetical protein
MMTIERISDHEVNPHRWHGECIKETPFLFEWIARSIDGIYPNEIKEERYHLSLRNCGGKN